MVAGGVGSIMKYISIFLFLLLFGIFAGCADSGNEPDIDPGQEVMYDIEQEIISDIGPEIIYDFGYDMIIPPEVTIISGEEAWDINEAFENTILLDVRNQDEFDDWFIAGSILIPVAELESRLSELPDKDAVIIVYCKAGGRSATAHEILTANGYEHVYDMQSIYNWPG
jgi:rhodanese-related sulfurtransferase